MPTGNDPQLPTLPPEPQDSVTFSDFVPMEMRDRLNSFHNVTNIEFLRRARQDLLDSRRNMWVMDNPQVQAFGAGIGDLLSVSYSTQNMAQPVVEPTNKKRDFGEYYSTKKGEIIKSIRPFGVEFEVNLSRDGQSVLRDMLLRAFSLVHDGSVNNGIELVTPILGGAVGELAIKTTAEKLSKVKAKTDESCGLHVHMDAQDFMAKHQARVCRMSEAIDLMSNKASGASLFGYILPEHTMKHFKDSNDDLYNVLSSYGKLDQFDICAFDNKGVARLRHIGVIPAGKMSLATEKVMNILSRRMYILGASAKNGNVRLPIIKGAIKRADYSGEIALGNIYDSKALVDIEYSKDVRVVVINKTACEEMDQELTRLKRLASFYLAFDDVIASMLPANRRTNDYTKRIGTRINVHDIRECKSILDFFNLWTKTSSLKSFKGTLNDTRHNSRYYGVNFRSLLKHGTIEIRYHGGTIDSETVLRWTALHQAIVDGCADLSNARFGVGRSERAGMIVNPHAKCDLMFSKLQLDTDTETFWRVMIEKYANDDQTLKNELMDNDNLSE